MNITKTLDAADRQAWRAWLEENHASEPEIWLVFYRKASGILGIPYNEAVEEALCFGWIDSTVKKIDQDRRAQRFTPRKPGSGWSEMNKVRFHRLLAEGKVAPAGLASFGDLTRENLVIPPDILQALQANALAWENFQGFPASYQQIRIGWIEGARNRPAVFAQRLRYFLAMTAKNQRFGMVQ